MHGPFLVDENVFAGHEFTVGFAVFDGIEVG